MLPRAIDACRRLSGAELFVDLDTVAGAIAERRRVLPEATLMRASQSLQTDSFPILKIRTPSTEQDSHLAIEEDCVWIESLAASCSIGDSGRLVVGDTDVEWDDFSKAELEDDSTVRGIFLGRPRGRITGSAAAGTLSTSAAIVFPELPVLDAIATGRDGQFHVQLGPPTFARSCDRFYCLK